MDDDLNCIALLRLYSGLGDTLLIELPRDYGVRLPRGYARLEASRPPSHLDHARLCVGQVDLHDKPTRKTWVLCGALMSQEAEEVLPQLEAWSGMGPSIVHARGFRDIQ